MIEVTLLTGESVGDYLGVIVPHPSGVTYCNQIGGFSVYPANLEGVFLPLPTELLEHDPLHPLWAPLPLDRSSVIPHEKIAEAWSRMVAGFLPDAFRRPTTDEIDSFAREHPSAACVGEAWIPLTVREDLSPDTPGCWYLAGLLGPFRGRVVVLTYGNSD